MNRSRDPEMKINLLAVFRRPVLIQAYGLSSGLRPIVGNKWKMKNNSRILIGFVVLVLGCGIEPSEEFRFKENNVFDISVISGVYTCMNSIGKGGIPHGGGDCTLGDRDWLVKITSSGILTKYAPLTCESRENYELKYDSILNLYRSSRDIWFTTEGSKIILTESISGTCFYQCELKKYMESTCKL